MIFESRKEYYTYYCAMLILIASYFIFLFLIWNKKVRTDPINGNRGYRENCNCDDCTKEREKWK